jgi:hypothetical protein
MLLHSHITWGMNNRPVGGRCSEAQSQLSDVIVVVVVIIIIIIIVITTTIDSSLNVFTMGKVDI